MGLSNLFDIIMGGGGGGAHFGGGISLRDGSDTNGGGNVGPCDPIDWLMLIPTKAGFSSLACIHINIYVDSTKMKIRKNQSNRSKSVRLIYESMH